MAKSAKIKKTTGVKKAKIKKPVEKASAKKNSAKKTVKKKIAAKTKPVKSKKRVVTKKRTVSPIKASKRTELAKKDSSKELAKLIAGEAMSDIGADFILNKASLEKKDRPNVFVYNKPQPKVSAHLLDLKNRIEIIEEETDSFTISRDTCDDFAPVKLLKEELSEQFTKPKLFILPLGWVKALAGFIVFSLIVAGPIQAFGNYYKLNKTKESVIGLATGGLNDLKTAQDSAAGKNLAKAGQYFSSAGGNFSSAKEQLDDINVLLQPILKMIPVEGKTLGDAENLLIVGENLSVLGRSISEIFDFFYNDSSSITVKIARIKEDSANLLPIAEETAEKIKKINPNAVPEENKEQFEQAKELIEKFVADLKTIDSLSDFLLEVLGDSQKKRYLVVFQNDRELRPTGGFIGSYAMVDIYQGEIKNIDMPGGGSYDLQGGLLEKIIPPKPLLLINNRWEFQDSNWFFDFPSSARKMAWFYEAAGGQTVDGVIAINAGLIEELLAYLPPIDLSEYGKSINADNFIDEIQKSVELEYDRSINRPKQILSDMAPKFLEAIFEAKENNLMNIAQTLNRSFAKKDIMMYLDDPEMETAVMDYNWAGEVKETSMDYLAVVAANIGGQKTDGAIKQDMELVSSIDNRGFIINHLTVKRRHNGSPDNVFENATNRVYLKIYVPQGSQIINSSGFSKIDAGEFFPLAAGAKQDEFLSDEERLIGVDKLSGLQIYEEEGKTVFADWVETKVGEESQIEISYMLPWQLTMPEKSEGLGAIFNSLFKKDQEANYYSLLIQKQSGAKSRLSASVILPGKQQITWTYPQDFILDGKSKGTLNADLDTDQMIGLVFEPQKN
ncbi:MAG TPA: DUF4012 domain-containing protein [Candidatus Bipolaricaulota bacterium]|nr:DUF4012 domain-containing protein [Candidatus Bipolaricaulota bacterium]